MYLTFKTATECFYLSVQSSCYGDDAAGAVVDGEHVSARALWVLRQDLIAQLAIVRARVVFILGCYRHYGCAWKDNSPLAINTSTVPLTISHQYAIKVTRLELLI